MEGKNLSPAVSDRLQSYVRTNRERFPELYRGESEAETLAKMEACFEAELAAIFSGERPDLYAGVDRETLHQEFCARLDAVALDEQQWNVLEAFSLLPPQPMPVLACEAWLDRDARLPQSHRTYQLLMSLGLLETVPPTSYRMHPLLAEIIYDLRRPGLDDHRYLTWQVANSLRNSPAATDPANSASYLSRLIQLADKLFCADELIAILYLRAGLYEAERGRAEQAAPNYAKARFIWSQILGDEHPGTVTTLVERGRMWALQGEKEQARADYQQALAVYRAEWPHTKDGLMAKYQTATLKGEDKKAFEFFMAAGRAADRWGYDDYSEREIEQALQALA